MSVRKDIVKNVTIVLLAIAATSGWLLYLMDVRDDGAPAVTPGSSEATVEASDSALEVPPWDFQREALEFPESTDSPEAPADDGALTDVALAWKKVADALEAIRTSPDLPRYSRRDLLDVERRLRAADAESSDARKLSLYTDLLERVNSLQPTVSSTGGAR